MKVFVMTTLLLAGLCVVGCRKNKPSVGRYYATFSYNQPTNLVRYDEIEITKTTEDYFVINFYDTISKSGRKVSGRTSLFSLPASVFYLDGEFKRKGLKNEFVISGDFSEEYWQGGIQYFSSGKFKIVSLNY